MNAVYSVNLQKKFTELDNSAVKSIDNKKPENGNIKLIFNGTKAEYEALSDEEKSKYSLVNLTNVGNDGETVIADIVEENNIEAVSSGAVYNAIKDKVSTDTDVSFKSVTTKNPLYVYPTDSDIDTATTRTFVDDKGIELQAKENEVWVSKGTIKRDANNNLFITNTDLSDDSLPQVTTTGVTALNSDAVIYHMEKSSTDSKGTNAANFTFEIKNYSASSLVQNGKYLLLKGSAEKSLEAEDICLFTNSDILIDNTKVSLEGTTVDTSVRDWNNKFKVKYFQWSNE